MVIKKILAAVFLFAILSCGRQGSGSGEVITVSIAPYKYFVEAIAGSDFQVNVMVPASSDPHIYEPVPQQIILLRKSVAYISNGYLGFEMTWLDRFYEANPSMKRLALSEKIEPLESEHHHEGGHEESADPHYWVSPVCAAGMAESVYDLLCALKPEHKEVYKVNYEKFRNDITALDESCRKMFAPYRGNKFMIYHPNLAYLARDYGLTEIPVEFEGKEPAPSRMRELIDLARTDTLKTIFVQKEYDTKNAKAIASETGAVIVIIDPLSENWPASVREITDALYRSFSNK